MIAAIPELDRISCTLLQGTNRCRSPAPSTTNPMLSQSINLLREI
jgi:hypothetical protein